MSRISFVKTIRLFSALKDAKIYLKEGFTFEMMDKIAYEIDDNRSANELQKARFHLFKMIDEKDFNFG